MSNWRFLRNLWRCFIILVFILAGSAISKSKKVATTNNSGVRNPPKVYYTIDCSIDLTKGLMEGIEIIHFRNTTSEPISRFEIRWIPGGNMEITSKGKDIKVLAETNGQSQSSSTVIEFLEPILSEETAALQIKFNILAPMYKGIDKIAVGHWYPHLWWGFETHDDYEVKLSVPKEYTIATSGLLNKETGYYHAENVRSFGLFLGKGFDSIEANAEDVHIRCIFAPDGRKCAELLLKTAVDVIDFYRERFGFYPSKCLTITPGMSRPYGGYPVATNIVAVHGMGQLDSMPKFHWQWITAHEIGHQYCGEYMLSNDPTEPFGWLMIGLGIYADREYTQARNLSSAKHQGFMDRYIGGVRAGYDTTINITPKQRSRIKFDFNNVVKHGKSYSVISALDSVLGKETFSRVYQRCLKEFDGRRLDVADFQTICQKETDQNLEWFFDQWVNSNKFLSYEISSEKSEKKKNRYVSTVKVKRTGDLKMPIPVAVYFEDGTSQIKLTDRLQDINILKFKSKSPLKKVKMDPEEALPFIPVTKPAKFEILDTEFEPIHQGKDNVVRVKVKNTSSQEQTFGIHIQTISPKYRGRKAGWGKSFFDAIKSNEIKDVPFEFEIFGPITDATWIRLQFYNPVSADKYDFEKWFKKTRYTFKDFEKFGVDRKLSNVASKKQTKLITHIFHKMQDYIKNEKYQETWQLFTKGFQRKEFSSNFEPFLEMMKLYKPKFIALEPASVTAKDGILTLTATSKEMTLVIEYTQVGNQWQINWMKATRERNWKERLLPTMQKHNTEHFDIHYYKDSTAEKEIDQIAEQREKGFAEICGFLGKDSDVRITIVFFENGKIKTLETGHQGAGWAYGNTIVEIYNDKEKLNPYHEIAHILMCRIKGVRNLFRRPLKHGFKAS